MAGHGFKDLQTAEYLKEAARRGIQQFVSGPKLEGRQAFLPSSKFLLAFPDGVISAADFGVTQDGIYSLGYGNANLVGRFDDGEFLSTEYPENTPESTDVVVTEDPETEPGELVEDPDPIYRTDCQTVRVWNPTQTVINSAGISGCIRCPFFCGLPLLLLQKESNGDLIIIAVVEVDNSQASTTTSKNIHESPCTGRCKFTYSAATKLWTKVSDTCATTTTTTSTSSTTTNPNETTTTPCLCPTSSTTTPDPQTTTTTTTPNCHCNYPTYCGDTDGECVYTDCSPIPNREPNCGQDTTTTTSTSTTTPNCNTTTTSSPACNPEPCVWSCVNNQWVKIIGVDCGKDCNPCPPPSDGPCDVNCDPVNTYCIKPSDGQSTPPCEWCGPGCNWIGVGTILGPRWGIFSNDCNKGVHNFCAPCACFPPSWDPQCGDQEFTPCVYLNGANPDDPNDPNQPPSDPYGVCYTSTTTTSTTTPNCNTAHCKWKAVGAYWALTFNNCLYPCPQCYAPVEDPIDSSCETRITACNPGTSTTTTTTTSSTTTPSPTCAQRFWQLICEGGVWVNSDPAGLGYGCGGTGSGGADAPFCCEPGATFESGGFDGRCQGGPCTNEGQVINGNCVGSNYACVSCTTPAPSTTTTSSAPTTTTTTASMSSTTPGP